MKRNKLPWGIVKITGGAHKGRIGNYDNDDDTEKYGVVYFGSPFIGSGYFLISHKYLAAVSTSDLMARHNEITKIITDKKKVSASKRADLLSELSLIDNELYDRMLSSRLTSGGKKSVFISYSSKDKQFARWLATDLTNAGHSPWLDEWKIRVGESIPVKISQGIQSCDALIVILSQDAVSSRWVENEWQAKYWDEINDGFVKVLPVLLKHCEVPTLLKTKKYADFREDYNEGLEHLLITLRDE